MSEEEKKEINSAEKTENPEASKKEETIDAETVKPEEKKEEWICPKCGTRNSTNFCSQCGTARPDGKKPSAPVWHRASEARKAEEKKKPNSQVKSGIIICICALLCGLGGGLIANGIAERNGSLSKEVDDLKQEVSDLNDKVEELESADGQSMIDLFGNLFGNGRGGEYSFNGNGGNSENTPDLFKDKEEVPDAVLGVMVKESDEGPVIQSFSEGSDAESAGLEKGDVIQKIDDDDVSSTSDIYKILKEKKAGDTVAVTVDRDGEEKTVNVKLIASSSAKNASPDQKRSSPDEDQDDEEDKNSD